MGLHGFHRQFSDYGSGSSTSSSTSWLSQDPARCQLGDTKTQGLDGKSSSYVDLVMGRCTLDDVMNEFRMNGSDQPYNPDEDKLWSPQTDEAWGAGPAYARQSSWPAAARRQQRPRSLHDAWPRAQVEFFSSTPVFDESPPPPFFPSIPLDSVTQEQSRVLNSLPDNVLYPLLRKLRAERRAYEEQECRFCRNNGDRESFYRSHVLKDSSGRVTCPVLRAFVCKRCGASGDRAHTIKYCPLSTNEERIKSAAMMRSVRSASAAGRRRLSAAADGARAAALDPLWAALEQKLMQ